MYLVTDIPNPAAPTVAQITAGVDITAVLRGSTGFTSEVADLNAEDQSSTWAKTIPGGETAQASSLNLYAGDLDADTEEVIRDAFVEGSERFVVFCLRGAPTAGEPANVFPVRIKAVNDQNYTSQEAANYMVGVSIFDPPSKNVSIA